MIILALALLTLPFTMPFILMGLAYSFGALLGAISSIAKMF